MRIVWVCNKNSLDILMQQLVLKWTYLFQEILHQGISVIICQKDVSESKGKIYIYM